MIVTHKIAPPLLLLHLLVTMLRKVVASSTQADLLESHQVLRTWAHVTKTFPTIVPNRAMLMMMTSSENGGFHSENHPSHLLQLRIG